MAAWCYIIAGSCLVAGVKCTVMKLNVQYTEYSALDLVVRGKIVEIQIPWPLFEEIWYFIILGN